MRRALPARSARLPKADPGTRRDRLAVVLAIATVVCVGSVLFLFKDEQFLKFLMPGPLTSAHGPIQNCSACHTRSGSGKLSWTYGLVAGNPVADSKACLACHNMPDTAFNAHGASTGVLEWSTKRLSKLAAATPVPQSARAQSIAFPTDDKVAHGLYCATCHQEHQGVGFNLSKISNEKCHSCHVVKFDSFDGHHPAFENYPFKRRSRIIYDHAGHFTKHFPEVAKKDPARRIPKTCSSCHDSRKDKRIMAVAPFEQTCAACHLDQIVGKERVSGPKGIAFLTLPGLDLQTLKRKKAEIGEWPAESEAQLTPFMKAMISRNARGRALIKTVDKVNLQDLKRANDAQIKAVTSLVWEIKGLFYALISGKASDVLGDLDIGGGAKLSASLIADLTASLPWDVVISAHQQWLPNLGTEMAGHRDTSAKEQHGGSATIAEPRSTGSASPQLEPAAERIDAVNVKPSGANEALSAERSSSWPAEPRSDGSESAGKKSGSDTGQATPDLKPARKAIPNPQACIVSVFGQCLVSKGSEDGTQPAKLGGPARGAYTANAKADAGKATLSGNRLAQAKAADQTDDLLFPTEDELRATKAGRSAGQAAQPERGAGKADTENARPDGAASADAASKADARAPAGVGRGSDAPTANARVRTAPEISIESDVDPESWAEYGGWYRQDYAIFYRPTGHKDKFIYAWLSLAGPRATKGDRSPAAAVFDLLTGKGAQGSCTKCHSVDNVRGAGRVVNFSPLSVKSKQGRFTNFIHEPHFGALDNRGCLACHNLEKARPYLKSYEQGNPQSFVSNFGAVKKDLCQTCHTGRMARQDCLLCHKYHVNGVITPIMNTRLPTE